MADYGHKETDKRLEALEKRVAAVYKQASEEMQQKLAQWYKDFERLDKKKAALVESGKLLEADYLAWRKGKMVESGRLKALVDTLTADYVNSDKIAMQIVRGDLTDVYALNANYAAYSIERDTKLDLSWTLYDHSTVERMLREDPDILPLPSVNVPLDERWNRQHLNNAITQGILQGESIPHIADRLQRILGMDHTAAVRSARTSTTAAECAGRIDTYKQAAAMGIQLKQMWRATLDGKTRHAHRLLDGQMVDIGEKFKVDGYELEYPGDPSAPGYLVYNCRCTVVSVDKFHDPNAPRASRLGDMSYEDWKAGKDLQLQKVVESSDKGDIIVGRVGNIQTKMPMNKYIKYSLDSDRQPDKAKAFKEALGYTRENVNALIANIQLTLKEDGFIEKGDSGHGMRYENIITLTGANGKTANVLTSWIKDHDSLRMTSVYVTKRGKGK